MVFKTMDLTYFVVLHAINCKNLERCLYFFRYFFETFFFVILGLDPGIQEYTDKTLYRREPSFLDPASSAG